MNQQEQIEFIRSFEYKVDISHDGKVATITDPLDSQEEGFFLCGTTEQILNEAVEYIGDDYE